MLKIGGLKSRPPDPDERERSRERGSHRDQFEMLLISTPGERGADGAVIKIEDRLKAHYTHDKLLHLALVIFSRRVS
jgi:hypothetical protein